MTVSEDHAVPHQELSRTGAVLGPISLYQLSLGQNFFPCLCGFGAGPVSLTQDPSVQYIHLPGLLIQCLPLQSLLLRLIKRKPTDSFLLPARWLMVKSALSVPVTETAKLWDISCESVTSPPLSSAIITSSVAALTLTGLGAENIFGRLCSNYQLRETITSI